MPLTGDSARVYTDNTLAVNVTGWGNTTAVTDASLHVKTNTAPHPTYWVARGPSSGSAPAAPTNPAATANNDKVLLVGWHPATSAKTVRIRRVSVSALLGTNVTYLYSIYRVAVAATGGTTVAVRPADPREAETEMLWMYQSTVATGTQLVNGSICDRAVIGTTGGHDEVVLYDWKANSDTKPITIAPNVLDGIAITSRCTTATAPDAVITVEYTEWW